MQRLCQRQGAEPKGAAAEAAAQAKARGAEAEAKARGGRGRAKSHTIGQQEGLYCIGVQVAVLVEPVSLFVCVPKRDFLYREVLVSFF